MGTGKFLSKGWTMFMICLSLICFSRNRVGGMSYVKDVAAYRFKDSIAAALFMSVR